MCFTHVLQNVRKRPFTSKVNKALIIDDIRKIQLASSKNMFEQMTRLFVEKWEPIERNFIEYFKKQWLGKLNALKKIFLLQKLQIIIVEIFRCT